MKTTCMVDRGVAKLAKGASHRDSGHYDGGCGVGYVLRFEKQTILEAMFLEVVDKMVLMVVGTGR